MINPNELRLGNWLKAGPLHEHLFPSGYFQLNGLDSHYTFATTNNALGFKDIEPIPLKPETLERSGYIKGFRAGFECFILSASGPISIAVAFLHDCERIYLNGLHYEVDNLHIHTLQNLYFALTGKELNITL